jgi:hypothetical protein
MLTKNFVLTSISLLLSLASFAGSVVLEGRYQQRNLFVINSSAPSGVGFCVYEVLVNGMVTSDEVNSQAFEIDLSIYGLKVGDPVTIVIKHRDGCTPKVINPGALEPAPTFDCLRIECNPQGQLLWETSGEMGKLMFVVQQFKWNKWINVGEVMGSGTSGKNVYRFQVSLTSGQNKFRVAQKSYEGEWRKSQAAEVGSTFPPISFRYDRKNKIITFSSDTNYELYNPFGQIVKRGYGSTLDLTSLQKSEYYISYDNRTDKFIRK